MGFSSDLLSELIYSRRKPSISKDGPHTSGVKDFMNHKPVSTDISAHKPVSTNIDADTRREEYRANNPLSQEMSGRKVKQFPGHINRDGGFNFKNSLNVKSSFKF